MSPEGGDAPLRLRLRNFRPDADAYLASLGGPLPYMLRLREIESLAAAHEEALSAAYAHLAAELSAAALGGAWRELVEAWSFDEVNDLIARHNRWYPVEARLRMDPKRRDYALVNGRDYRLRPLDARWALEQVPDAGSSGRAQSRHAA